MSTKDLLASFDVSSRLMRRRATSFAIELLERIRFAEETNLERFPLNLQNGDAFLNAGYSLDVIIDAIITLRDAY